MLRKHTINVDEVTIPYSDNRYTISITGIVKDLLENRQISDSNGKFEICLFNNKKEYNIAWLMAISFKPVFKSESFIENWKILFVDSNSKNIHPSNLIWKPPINGQECPEVKGFYVIPGYSYYAINKEGFRYYRYLNTFCKRKKIIDSSNFKYECCSLKLDNGERSSMGLHRALGLAFLDYQSNVCNMTINHKDGIKLNNDISNLEWATYRENNIHARDMKLNNTRRVTLLKDHYTGEIIKFICLAHASEYLNINDGWVYQMIDEYPNKPINFRYSGQFEDNLKQWPFFTKEDLIEKERLYNERLYELQCKAINIYTKEVFIADGPGMLGQLLGITKDQAGTGLETPYPWPSFNYVFSWLKDQKEERKFEEDELACFKDKSGIKNPVRVTKSDGSTQVYVSPSEFSLQLGLPSREIADKIYSEKFYRNSKKYCKDDFCVEYIDY